MFPEVKGSDNILEMMNRTVGIEKNDMETDASYLSPPKMKMLFDPRLTQSPSAQPFNSIPKQFDTVLTGSFFGIEKGGFDVGDSI